MTTFTLNQTVLNDITETSVKKALNSFDIDANENIMNNIINIL